MSLSIQAQSIVGIAANMFPCESVNINNIDYTFDHDFLWRVIGHQVIIQDFLRTSHALLIYW